MVPGSGLQLSSVHLRLLIQLHNTPATPSYSQLLVFSGLHTYILTSSRSLSLKCVLLPLLLLLLLLPSQLLHRSCPLFLSPLISLTSYVLQRFVAVKISSPLISVCTDRFSYPSRRYRRTRHFLSY